MRKTRIKRIFDSKLLWLILSLIFSVLIWVYVTSVEGAEKDATFSGIQVVFRGQETLAESKGLIVTEQDYTTVTVKLSASRRVLSQLSKDNITAIIDLSQISSAGRNRYQYTLGYPATVDAASVTLVDCYPEVIEFYVDKQSTKPVEVKAVFEGSVAEGFTSELPVVEPTTIKISGPEKEISKVSYAYVVIDRADVDSTLNYEAPFTLVDSEYNEVVSSEITTDRDTVAVTLPVLATKEVALSVDVIAGGGATIENADIKIEPESITLAGDSKLLDGLNKISLGTIDLSDFENTYQQTYTIVYDNELENLSGDTEATVTITIKGLEAKWFTITNLSCSNVTAGHKATVLTKSIRVLIRTDAKTLAAIASNNIRAVADLSELGNTVGEFMVPVKISVDGYTTIAGAVGDYTAYISVEVDTGDDEPGA